MSGRTRYVPARRRRCSTRDDLDEVAVARILEGDMSIAATWAELDAAMARLRGDGAGTTEIAERLGVCRETVQRHDRRRRRLMEG